MKLRSRTLQIHGGGSLQDVDLRPGLHRVVGFPLRGFDRAKRIFAGEEEGFVYSRINNPTVDRLEKKLASLEGTESCLATSSGMSAIKLVVEALANNGGHIVSSNRLYGGVFYLFGSMLTKLGIEVTFIEKPHDINLWTKAVRKNTRLFYLENPSNPLIDIFDTKRIAEAAHGAGIPLVVDSTLATPALCRPLEFGADIVVHSLSKYMGDGEVVGGAILGRKDFLDKLKIDWFRDSGPCLSPDNAAILLYHLESLFARMKEHCDNATLVARFLGSHPRVLRVFYPPYNYYQLVSHGIMPNGFGGLMAFELIGGEESAKKTIESLQLFWHAANIGESRSLIIHPWSTTHGRMSEDDKIKAGITPGIIRLSIGREDPLDLIDDLRQAIDRI